MRIVMILDGAVAVITGGASGIGRATALARGSGYVVNTASFAGLVAHNPLTIPYDVTKHGVVGLSAGLALYLKPKGIGVSVLCPGYVETNLSENYRFRGLEAAVGPTRMP